MAFDNIVMDTVVGAFGTEITFAAAVDIAAGQIVSLSNGQLIVATASSVPVGIALYDIPAGSEGAVRVCGCSKAVASAAITAGTFVSPTADGKCVTATTGNVLGIALDSAAAADDEIRVAIAPSPGSA